jgi:predicted O-methyltransferase YrrM
MSDGRISGPAVLGQQLRNSRQPTLTRLMGVPTATGVRDALFRRAEWAILRGQGSTDLRRIRQDLPGLPGPGEIGRAADDLRPAYQTYITEVSAPGMAASLETTALLLALCRAERVTSAIDLGSGFSSYALRLWAREADCVVFSVDDDPAWLTRTKEFLAGHDVPSGDLSLWPTLPNRTFELVFHDLANGVRREEAMATALHASSRLVIFDDAQHRGHRAAMKLACVEVGARLYSLRALTVDWMKRYSMLAVR